MRILTYPAKYAQLAIDTYGTATQALEALCPDAVEDVWPRVPASFWEKVREHLREAAQRGE
jgi:hypothetical protein